MSRGTAAELGSAARPRRRKNLGTVCPVCREAALWGNWFTADGDGSDGRQPGDRWLTVCGACGTFFA